MNQDFFSNLPSEIIINILSRLSIRTIIYCKCVCKSWLDLLETHEFGKSHLSKSVPGLVYQGKVSTIYSSKLFEFVDVLDLEHHELHYNLITNLDTPHNAPIECSAGGLLFLRDTSSAPHAYYICNPITREYIKLNSPQEFDSPYSQALTFGFGTSKMTGQYKVVVISLNYPCIHVYTLGTGSWRRVGPGARLKYHCNYKGVFVNGNLHWLCELKGSPWISCFDLETELFSTLSPPPLQEGLQVFVADIFALGDCLCLCDTGSYDNIIIWSMKEYGVEKSWTKEFVISRNNLNGVGDPYEFVRPIKIFKDGDILMAWEDWLLKYYSSKTKTIEHVDTFGLGGCIKAIIHMPSFLSLKIFEIENVSSF